MDFHDIVMHRFAAKKFTGESIPEEKVEKLKELIRFAPTSFNIQPWKVIVVTNQATKDALQKASWNQEQVGTASHVLVFCANTDVSGAIDRLSADYPPALIEVMRNFFTGWSQEQTLVWAQKQAYIALGNAMNGATSLGFDSCPMEGFDAQAYATILNTPEHLVPSVVLPIGITAAEPRPKLRFDDMFIDAEK